MEQSTPEIIAINKEFSTNFWHAVWTMPSSLRLVVTHIYLCNRSYVDLAQLLQVSVSDIESTHEQAVAYLKERIQQKWQLQ